MSLLSEAQAVNGKDFAWFQANANGITFNSGAWCVDFVRWCAKKAGVTLASTTSSSSAMRDAYNNAGKLSIGTAGIKAGDIFFSSKNGAIAHTGIATSGASGGSVGTINGNWPDKVATQTLPGTSAHTIESYVSM